MFLDMTPKAFNQFLSKHTEERSNAIRAQWEMTRMIIYYGLEFKTPMRYKDFCRQMLPFVWDEKEESYEVTQELIDNVFNTQDTNVITSELTDISELKSVM